ncbi:SDR family oxidoreductase [Burkholderia multivorans]|jgi:glucose 1-dehydrogenase|uniref:SDR family NAD(P)-dependent oxidoreductase n=1 Tax=Burkholderia multivorans TaxID=87883 RepID=UPI000CFE4841|nr:glucose 1-dehydrogenase [Burkholderia multivorans]MDN8006351.1 SDR family oxidoreductase [Burkholderia multivorans]PRF72846.1 glucose 1-dehydrogenase [Burkholderia multivorans]PRG97104.1 glucose 1-dehydrogenase [Burkholderia multivorans]UQO99513.1 SDR family oxidoreductase [Burkholderia multivorans]
MKLQGIRALVTGADSGIGQAIATLFAQEGADVAIVYHTDHDGAQETVRRIQALGRRACAIQADVGDPRSVDAFFAEAMNTLGGLEVLVNNAGVGAPGAAVADLEDAQIDTVLRTDLLGPLYCCRAFVRQRRAVGGGGRIVNISSVAQHLPTPESAPYGIAKAGLGSLARSLSREVAEDRINVNNIAPGLIDTPMTRDRLNDPQQRDASMSVIPWHRPGQPEEIALVALFLASDDGDYVTGQTWTIDGGLTMQWGGA